MMVPKRPLDVHVVFVCVVVALEVSAWLRLNRLTHSSSSFGWRFLSRLPSFELVRFHFCQSRCHPCPSAKAVQQCV